MFLHQKRLTVRTMMVVVAMFSLNIAVIPWLMDAFQTFGVASIGVPEMSLILAIILPSLALRLVRTGEIGGFPLGFEAFGWAAVLVYLACLVFAPKLLAAWGDSTITPLWRAIGPAHTMFADRASGEIQVSIAATDRTSMRLMGLINVCVYTFPQLTFAALGGMSSQRLGVRLVVGRRNLNVHSSVEIKPK